jgi:UTP--glucose-1-phosphate uridylyltransferase
MSVVKTAVFPVGGLGTRFLPATKALPKELLPVVDKPLLQYAVEEAIEAGIETLIFVTGRGKSAIEDHFDISYELESTLSDRGDTETLAMLDEFRPDSGQIAYVRQMQPLGLGHAVWCARHLVGNSPFAVMLADDFLYPSSGVLASMIAEYESTDSNVVLVEEVAPEATASYGIITPGATTPTATQVTAIVEKPQPEVAPSHLGVIGRYVLHPSIMDILQDMGTGALGEIQLTDALAASLEDRELHAVTNTGKRFDCGSKLGMIEATLAVALDRDDLGDQVRAVLAELDSPLRVDPQT